MNEEYVNDVSSHDPDNGISGQDGEFLKLLGWLSVLSALIAGWVCNA